MSKIYNSITELIGNTPIVKLNNIVPEDAADVYVKIEAFNPGSSVKDRIALRMIEDAEKAKAEEEKARIAAEKAEEKKGKKILEDIRRDMNESLEEKVFRSENNPEARIAAAGAAFEIGKERMAFLKMEEEEIMKLEEVLGMEPDENRVFLSQKFDEVYDQFNSNNNEIELLLLENEKLNEYLSRLDKMEQIIAN